MRYERLRREMVKRQIQARGIDDPLVVAAMLGPTGNLRAPCLRTGKTVIVGFNEELYESIFG